MTGCWCSRSDREIRAFVCPAGRAEGRKSMPRQAKPSPARGCHGSADAGPQARPPRPARGVRRGPGQFEPWLSVCGQRWKQAVGLLKKIQLCGSYRSLTTSLFVGWLLFLDFKNVPLLTLRAHYSSSDVAHAGSRPAPAARSVRADPAPVTSGGGIRALCGH